MPESGTSSGRPAGALSNDDDGSEQPSEYRSLKFDEFHSRQANEQSRQGQSARTYWPTKSSGESGSEADDEGFTFLKALPPPPVRQRKGLRSKIDEDISPLLTPSRSEERTRSWANTCVPGTTPERTGSPMPIEKQTRKLWNRRKREAFRRIVELLLFASVIHVVLKKSLNLSLDHRHCGGKTYSCTIESDANLTVY